MADAAIELLARIRADFERRVEQDAALRRVAERIRNGTAAQSDAHVYAEHIGTALSAALRDNLTEERLPNGTLYWNIAARTIRPMLENNHRLANDVASEIQQLLDAAQGVGLAPIPAPLPSERIRGLVDKAVRAETHEEMRRWLGEPIVNCTESFVDDFVQTNAEARYRSGLSPKIVRTAAPGCCAWCEALAGTYDYADVRSGSEVYRRHEYCRCTVTFSSGGKYQSVHSKRWYDDEREARVARSEEIERRRAAEAEAKAVMRSRVQSGQYDLTLSPQKYAEHVEGTPQYRQTGEARGRDLGRLTISREEAQTLINRYSGTGTPRVSRSGKVSDVEYVSVGRVIGQYFDAGAKEWIDTGRAAIYHGKNGSHIVPVKPGRREQ